MHNLKKMIVLLSLVFSTYGCAAMLLGVGAGVGIGAYKYIEGVLVREYPLNYARAWDATNAALRNLQVSVSDSMNEGTVGKIEGVRIDGIEVVIKLTDKGQGVTSIAIRVGKLGDRDAATRVHDEIAKVAGIS